MRTAALKTGFLIRILLYDVDPGRELLWIRTYLPLAGGYICYKTDDSSVEYLQ
jgi:hypothetical protein